MRIRELAWGDRVSRDFREGVYAICQEFGWSDDHASWLMACIAFESAETFNPAIRNFAGSGAIGLIQFMPRTAIGLGTTTAELSRMSPTHQLSYVKMHFYPYAKRIETLSDMYMAILLPKYVGKPPSTVLFSGGTAYRQNSGLDANKDGKITKAEATIKVIEKLMKGRQRDYVRKERIPL